MNTAALGFGQAGTATPSPNAASRRPPQPRPPTDAGLPPTRTPRLRARPTRQRRRWRRLTQGRTPGPHPRARSARPPRPPASTTNATSEAATRRGDPGRRRAVPRRTARPPARARPAPVRRKSRAERRPAQDQRHLPGRGDAEINSTARKKRGQHGQQVPCPDGHRTAPASATGYHAGPRRTDAPRRPCPRKSHVPCLLLPQLHRRQVLRGENLPPVQFGNNRPVASPTTAAPRRPGTRARGVGAQPVRRRDQAERSAHHAARNSRSARSSRADQLQPSRSPRQPPATAPWPATISRPTSGMPNSRQSPRGIHGAGRLAPGRARAARSGGWPPTRRVRPATVCFQYRRNAS